MLNRFGYLRAGQEHGNVHGGRIRKIAFDALLDVVLGILEPVGQFEILALARTAREEELHAAVVGFDGRDLVEQFGQTLLPQP